MKQLLKNNRWGLLWGVCILALTGIPGSFFPQIPRFFDLFRPDKLVHLFMFMVFVFLLADGMRREGNPLYLMKHPVLIAMVLGVALGGLTELMQGYLIPMRIGSPWDFIANTAGCLVGWALFRLYRRRV
jgi:VanZ family protein